MQRLIKKTFNFIISQKEPKVKTAKPLKLRKTRLTKSRLDQVLRLIGSEDSACLLDQSHSEVKQNRVTYYFRH